MFTVESITGVLFFPTYPFFPAPAPPTTVNVFSCDFLHVFSVARLVVRVQSFVLIDCLLSVRLLFNSRQLVVRFLGNQKF